MKKVAGIILAAGRGTRFKSKTTNKVALNIAGKPIILYGVELLKKLNISPIIIVVGFAKESVKEVLKQEAVIFGEQKKPQGTGDAVLVGLKKLPKNIKHALVLNGDDALFLTQEIIDKFVKEHLEKDAALTLLTIELASPKGIGRVVRDKNGKVIAIIEEKDATNKERTIKEVNGLGYVFKIAFLKKYLKLIKKSSVTGEYYLTSLVEIAAKNKEKIADLRASKIPWRGINTEEDLKEAERLLLKLHAI